MILPTQQKLRERSCPDGKPMYMSALKRWAMILDKGCPKKSYTVSVNTAIHVILLDLHFLGLEFQVFNFTPNTANRYIYIYIFVWAAGGLPNFKMLQSLSHPARFGSCKVRKRSSETRTCLVGG